MRRLLVAALLLGACSSKKSEPVVPATASPVSYQTCKSALRDQKLDLAERCFDRLVEQPSGDDVERTNALFALASIKQERGEAKAAVAYALRATALRPDDAEAQEVLVELAHDAGDRAAERAGLEALVKLDPDALDRRLQLGGVLAAMKLGEEAKQAFLGYEDARVRLLQVLGHDPSAVVRRAAAERLAAASDAGTARALVLAMTDRDAGVRAAAVRSVSAVGLDVDKEVRPALEKLRELEKDSKVLAELAEALTAPPASGSTKK